MIPTLDLLTPKGCWASHLPSFTSFSPFFAQVLRSGSPQIFFSGHYFFRKKDKALTSSLTSLSQPETPEAEAPRMPLPPCHMHPLPEDKGRPEVHLWAHLPRTSASSLEALQNPEPHSPPVLQTRSPRISILSIREEKKKKNAFLVAVSRRQELFQLNDLQIKSIKPRMHLLNLFPILPRCPHNFLP